MREGYLYREWTDEMEEQLTSLRDAGKTIDEIADAIGKTPKSIAKRVRKLGLQRQKREYDFDEKLIALRAAGKNYEQIARELGITRHVVCNRIRKFRLPLPKKTIKRPIEPEIVEIRPDPELLQLAEGHVASDQRSFEIWMEVLR